MGVANTEIIHQDAGGLGHGYREEGRRLRAEDPRGPEEEAGLLFACGSVAL